MANYPHDIESPSVYLGEYKGWRIIISKARGEVEDGDTLSLSASNGITSFDSSFGEYAPRGKPFLKPSDVELKEELDNMKKRIDNYNYEFKKIAFSSFDPTEYIKNWNKH